MRLGSFQVDQEFEQRHMKFPALTQHLGYYPRFCFKAESWQDIIKYGLFAAPNSVDNLFIFETDEYELISTVEWNRYILTQSEEDFDKCIHSSDPDRSEYIVKKIPDFLYQMRPQKWMPKPPHYISSYSNARDWAGEQFGEQSLLYRYASHMLSEETNFIETFVKPSLDRSFNDNYSQLIAAIQIFKFDFLFFHCSFNMMMIDYVREERDDSIFDRKVPLLPVFDWRKYLDLNIRGLMAKLCNTETGLEYKTIEMYDQIDHLIDSCFSTFADCGL